MNEILCGDALTILRGMPDESVQMCVTSPPYYGLRDYQTPPIIWNGDEQCEHEWGEAQRTPWANSVSGPNGRKKNTSAGHWKSKETGPFCQLCDAWSGGLGQEPTPDLYISHLVQIFREVRRVLRSDGVCWVNIGDSFAGYWGDKQAREEERPSSADTNGWTNGFSMNARPEFHQAFDGSGIKPKDLIGIPWMLAFALRTDGWYLRQDVIWHIPNSMPESVTDRPTTDYEHVFLLTKSPRYFYDHFAIREEGKEWKGQAGTFARSNGKATHLTIPGQARVSHRAEREDRIPPGRNKRTVWSINTEQFPGEHYATYPKKLAEVCILAGSSPKACEKCAAPWKRVLETTPMEIKHGPKAGGYGSRTTDGLSGTMVAPAECRMQGWEPTCRCAGTTGSGKCIVLDPFMGAGTTALVAIQHHRNWLGIELNPTYAELARKRIATVQTTLWGEGAD